MATVYLATVIGWYLIIMSLFLLFQYEHAKSIMVEVLAQRSVLFLAAILTVLMGLLMVASHNLWVMGWPVVVTVFSWMVLIGGLVRLFFLDHVIKLGKQILKNPIKIKSVAIVYLLLGLFLLFHVYTF